MQAMDQCRVQVQYHGYTNMENTYTGSFWQVIEGTCMKNKRVLETGKEMGI